MVFRFAHYLQEEIKDDYCVDCDFNASKKKTGKPIENRRRFIDVVVHDRDWNNKGNLMCFEFKKWNNYNKSARDKDKNNLKIMTKKGADKGYNYNWGFFIILGKTKKSIKCTVYKDGIKVCEKSPLLLDMEQGPHPSQSSGT